MSYFEKRTLSHSGESLLTLFVSSAYVSDTVSGKDTKMSVLNIEIAWHDDLFQGI